MLFLPGTRPESPKEAPQRMKPDSERMGGLRKVVNQTPHYTRLWSLP